MLEAMYSPVTEQQYLSYATNLLLEMTSKSPDYQREIFEHPLSECKFSVSIFLKYFPDCLFKEQRGNPNNTGFSFYTCFNIYYATS
jgi:hypothetical protein